MFLWQEEIGSMMDGTSGTRHELLVQTLIKNTLGSSLLGLKLNMNWHARKPKHIFVHSDFYHYWCYRRVVIPNCLLLWNLKKL